MDNWQVGDLALCVMPGSWAPLDDVSLDGPEVGGIHSVDCVRVDGDGSFIGFPEWPEDLFVQRAFRKLKPHVPDAEDEITIRLLNGTPVRETTHG